MRNQFNTYISKHKLSGWFVIIMLCCISTAWAQTKPQVTSTVDSTKIKIGQQINFKIHVVADTTAHVFFPEIDAKSFAPLEVIDDTKVDTVIENDKLNLIKNYGLTKFDSGSYTIPQQKILVDNDTLFTDSVKVFVNTVAVDTTKQKMYDIKGLVAVKENNANWWTYILFVVGFIVVLGAALYWFIFKRKPLTEEEKVALLPAYDRALLELKKLDESKYLIQSEYKEYYSHLTQIVRQYLEEDVHINALDSTTDELLIKLEALKQAGTLNIDEATLKQFKIVLQTADLVKFAKQTPESSVVSSDRKIIEDVVVKTKSALPEPTEEELQKTEEYKQELIAKRRKKRMIIGGVTAILIIFIAIGASVAYFGYNTVKDNILGHPTKELLDSDWVYSEYGFPAIAIETPKVLRRINVELPAQMQAVIKSNQTFGYGSIFDNFYIIASTVTLKQNGKADPKKVVQGTLATFGQLGAKNIITKQEDFTTNTGKEGIKVYGTMDVPLSKEDSTKTRSTAYQLYVFAQDGGIEQLYFTYNENDTYAQQIIERITNSLDIKGLN
ncbi:hypothetical protein ACG2LH_02125 [Zhouia sp. PK063]|uniref:hypothetical protein n=1 Tax=Zhouia sp. PK063 TaxID=3373602 RepID=UPI0037B7A763